MKGSAQLQATKKIIRKDQDPRMANQLGKVYICNNCKSQVIVTKGGTGQLKCCGVPMEQKK
jgi:desulfoferrodoxin-like iron-binding protein